MNRRFTIVIEHQGEGFVAYCREMPDVRVQGETVEACQKRIREVIVRKVNEAAGKQMLYRLGRGRLDWKPYSAPGEQSMN